MFPLIEVILLFGQWFVPMRVQGHRRVHDITNIISHISCLDVFVVSCIVVIYELNLLINSTGLGQYLKVTVTMNPFIAFYVIIIIVMMFIRQQVSSLASRYMTFRTLTLASSLSGYLGENLLLRGGDDINDIEIQL